MALESSGDLLAKDERSFTLLRSEPQEAFCICCISPQKKRSVRATHVSTCSYPDPPRILLFYYLFEFIGHQTLDFPIRLQNCTYPNSDPHRGALENSPLVTLLLLNFYLFKGIFFFFRKLKPEG